MTAPVLSLQLYTVRDALSKNPAATLDHLASLGFRNVEAFGFVGRAAELRASLDAAGLTASSGHASFLSDGPPIDDVLDDAEMLGIKVLVDPIVQPDRWVIADDVARTADRLNAAADRAASRGIRVGYHNHSHEFHHRLGETTAYEAFVACLDPAVVLELDVYWAQVGGEEPGALVARLGERVVAMHIKDGRVDTDPFRTGGASPWTLGQVPAGRGVVALEAALDAATALELAIVEFDQVEGDVFRAIDGSSRYLAERGIR